LIWKRQTGLFCDKYGGCGQFRMDDLGSSTTKKTKKEERKERKRKKAIAEFRLAQSNDNMKRVRLSLLLLV